MAVTVVMLVPTAACSEIIAAYLSGKNCGAYSLRLTFRVAVVLITSSGLPESQA